MNKDIILFYPISLILLSIVLRKISFGKIFDLFFSTFQLVIANIICTNTVKFLTPGDYIAYKRVFESCSSIKNCLDYSPFEKTFTYIIGFANEFTPFNSEQIWSLINIINLILITLISFLISKYFSNRVSTLSIQSLLIGTTFTSFLTISIRSGLSFLLISLALYKILELEKDEFDLKNNLLIFLIFILSITIHVQSILFIVFCFCLFITKFFGIKIGIKDSLNNLISGYISKRILKLFIFISLGNVLMFFNFRKIVNMLGKAYYRLQFLEGYRSLGIKSIVHQFIIYFIILKEVRNSNIYKKNKSFINFFQLLNLFQVTSFLIYYSFLFFFGIDGFARQMQYNFLLYIIIYIASIDKFKFINLFPFAYLIYEVYYTMMNDVSFFKYL